MGILGIVGNAKLQNAANGLGRYDVKRTNNWVLEFSQFGTSVLRNSLIIQLQKAARPALKIGEAKLSFANESWYVATKPEYEPLGVTFYDALPSSGVEYVMNRSSGGSPHPDGNKDMVSSGQILYDWWLLMYDPASGRIGVAADYKATAFITMYNAWNTPVERWMYVGLFPTSIGYGELSYTDEGGPALVSCSFRFDKVYRMADPTASIEPLSTADQRGPEDPGQLGLNLQ